VPRASSQRAIAVAGATYRYGLTPDPTNIVTPYPTLGRVADYRARIEPAGSPERLSGALAAEHYVAIVESSDDAILSKDLDGVIMTWNRGAQLLFGYTAEEAVGQPVTILIPTERHDEEPMILERVRQGQSVDHYETVRQRKDGSLIDISLTVSPIKNDRGEIVGASKIARDITESKRAQAQQELLLREMDHRVKNLFTLAISLLTLSGRYASTVPELVDSTRDRLSALARAHALTLYQGSGALHSPSPATLHSLIEAIAAPHLDAGDNTRFSIIGCNMEISGSTISSVALLLHEFATNSVKYGALSSTTGRIQVHCADRAGNVVINGLSKGGRTSRRRSAMKDSATFWFAPPWPVSSRVTSRGNGSRKAS
jgi:PAS domain S-box-containing protein